MDQQGGKKGRARNWIDPIKKRHRKLCVGPLVQDIEGKGWEKSGKGSVHSLKLFPDLAAAFAFCFAFVRRKSQQYNPPQKYR